jgi:hypothetical protein
MAALDAERYPSGHRSCGRRVRLEIIVLSSSDLVTKSLAGIAPAGILFKSLL